MCTKSLLFSHCMRPCSHCFFFSFSSFLKCDFCNFKTLICVWAEGDFSCDFQGYLIANLKCFATAERGVHAMLSLQQDGLTSSNTFQLIQLNCTMVKKVAKQRSTLFFTMRAMKSYINITKILNLLVPFDITSSKFLWWPQKAMFHLGANWVRSASVKIAINSL